MPVSMLPKEVHMMPMEHKFKKLVNIGKNARYSTLQVSIPISMTKVVLEEYFGPLSLLSLSHHPKQHRKDLRLIEA